MPYCRPQAEIRKPKKKPSDRSLALVPFQQTDCETAYVQRSGSRLGYKTKARLFQHADNNFTPVGPAFAVDFTSAVTQPTALGEFVCNTGEMTTLWTVPSTAIYQIIVNIDFTYATNPVATEVNRVRFSLQRNPSTPLTRSDSSLSFIVGAAAQESIVAMTWIGQLTAGDTLSVICLALPTNAVLQNRTISIVEL